MNITHERIAETFSALAHPRRVELFEQLLAHAPDGSYFDNLQQLTAMPASTRGWPERW